MTRDVDPLFRPFNVRGMTLANRVVMAPMTRYFCPTGAPGADVVGYYERRANGGAGLILSEGTAIDRPGARNDPRIPMFHGEGPLRGWKTVIDAVHSANGKMGPQLWHVGSVPNVGTLTLADEEKNAPWTQSEPIESPSGFWGADEARGQAMNDAMIADTIAAYSKGAADAKRLGFDTVEVHGAHGYLPDQFFWDVTNRRTDKYGGDTLVARSRFAIELVQAMREAVGSDFPIIFRLSQWKAQDYTARMAKTPQELEAWLTPLVDAGVDVLHCSQRRFWEPEFPEVDGAEGLNLAGWAKKVTGAATITVGSIGLNGADFLETMTGKCAEPANLENLMERLDRNEFDLVAIGRALLGDPEWPRKVSNKDFNDLAVFDPESYNSLA